MKRWMILSGLAVLLLAVGLSQRGLRQAQERSAQRALEEQNALQAQLAARRQRQELAERKRREDLRAALRSGPPLEKEKQADGTPSEAEWQAMTETCIDALRQSGPRVSLRVSGSTGFAAAAASEADRRSLGFAWDHGVRLDTEASDGSGRARFDCFFLDTRLVQLRRVNGG